VTRKLSVVFVRFIVRRFINTAGDSERTQIKEFILAIDTFFRSK
jgi:hypothetical protein